MRSSPPRVTRPPASSLCCCCCHYHHYSVNEQFDPSTLECILASSLRIEKAVKFHRHDRPRQMMANLSCAARFRPPHPQNQSQSPWIGHNSVGPTIVLSSTNGVICLQSHPWHRPDSIPLHGRGPTLGFLEEGGVAAAAVFVLSKRGYHVVRTQSISSWQFREQSCLCCWYCNPLLEMMMMMLRIGNEEEDANPRAEAKMQSMSRSCFCRTGR